MVGIIKNSKHFMRNEITQLRNVHFEGINCGCIVAIFSYKLKKKKKCFELASDLD